MADTNHGSRRPAVLRPLARVTAGVAVLWLCLSAAARQENPVWVDDSPRAWELFQLAEDQIRNNPGEAVRLFQELLDEYALKLIPVTDTSIDHFTSVRQRVMPVIHGHPALLQRYQTMEAATAQRMLADDAIGELALTRVLTVPGLEAALRLGQRAVEDARFREGLDWLAEASAHPSLTPGKAAHCWFMTAVAAHYLGQGPRLREAMERLGRIGPEADPFLARLRLTVAAGRGPSIASGISPLDQPETTDLTDLVAEEIWSVPLEDSLLSRRFSAQAGGDQARHPAREQLRRNGELMTALATVAGSTIFINQGHTVLALDRFTGRPRWTFVDRTGLAAVDRSGDQSIGLSFVSVSGESVVTLTGHATADGRSIDGRVLCLEARTGDLRWSRRLDRIGNIDDHEGLFPHGRPIVADGAVYVQARKITRQLLSSCYVVCLDLESGRLRWARHVASSGGLRRSTRRLATLAAEDGELYVATPVGAVARLHAPTGEIRWLHRYQVPISNAFQQNQRPWEMASAVLTPEALVSLHPDERHIVVLDRETGHQLERLTADSIDGWGSARYLLANEHSVFAVGRDVRAFRIGQYERPAWRYPRPAQSTEPGVITPPERVNIRGRVQVVPGALIVPSLDGVLLIDDETGLVQHRLPVRHVGTPLAVEAQLLLAGSDRLHAYMSFGRAEQMLRQRIAAAPDDPEPALSLLRLGARANQLPLALEAAELARGAIERAPESREARAARRDLFDTLLDIDLVAAGATDEQGEGLFAMVRTIAMLPEQQVEQLLAHGGWLSSRSLAAAIELYQEILDEPLLAGQWRSEQGLVRPAYDWTTRRLDRLIDAHGRTAYAPQADFASMRVRGLLNAAHPDPALLLELACRFPFADAALTATSRAARVLHRQGEDAEAVAALLQAYRRAGQPEAATALLGHGVEICIDAGWSTAARDLLGHVVREHGDLELETDKGSRPAVAWLAELNGRAAPVRPAVGEQSGLAEVLPGRLVPVHPGAMVEPAADRALLFDGVDLRQIAAKGLAERWRYPLQDSAPQLLYRDDERLVLWFGTNLDDPRAVMLSAAHGTELWSTPPLRQHLADPVRDLVQERGVREQMPNGEPFNPKDVLPLAGADLLVLVQRSGGVAGFDLADATAPKWTTPRTLEQVHFAALHEFGLVVAGVHRQMDARNDGGALEPRLLILDPATGRVVKSINPLGDTGVRWMRIGPLGTLVYATDDGLEAVDLLTGAKLWANVDHAVVDTQLGWACGDRIVLADRESGLRTLRFDQGVASVPFALPAHGEWDPLELQDMLCRDRGVYAIYRQRVVRFDLDGAVLGADIITDSRDYGWLLPVRDGLLLVSRYNTEQAVIPDRTGRRTQHTYRIYRLSPDCMVRGEMELHPITHRLYEAAAIEGWLLASTQSDTLAIPMPAAR